MLPTSAFLLNVPLTRRITLADVVKAEETLTRPESWRISLREEADLWELYRRKQHRFEPDAAERFEALLNARVDRFQHERLRPTERLRARFGQDVFERRANKVDNKLSTLMSPEAARPFRAVAPPTTSRGVPELNAAGLPPPGVHEVTWDELASAFGFNDHRKTLLAGLLRAAHNVRDAGGDELLLGGSFITKKEHPADFDAIADFLGLDEAKLDPLFAAELVTTQKTKYGGELLPLDGAAGEWSHFKPFVEFLQKTREGEPRGLFRLKLSTLPPPQG